MREERVNRLSKRIIRRPGPYYGHRVIRGPDRKDILVPPRPWDLETRQRLWGLGLLEPGEFIEAGELPDSTIYLPLLNKLANGTGHRWNKHLVCADCGLTWPFVQENPHRNCVTQRDEGRPFGEPGSATPPTC